MISAYELYCDPESDKASRSVTKVGSQSSTTLPKLSIFKRFKNLFTNKVSEPPTNQNVSMAEWFKRAFSQKNVKVHFVGAWYVNLLNVVRVSVFNSDQKRDTVSSIGIVRGTHMLPGTVDGMTHVYYFRHALALDERRVKFLPEYAYGGSSKSRSKPDNIKYQKRTHNAADNQKLYSRLDDHKGSEAIATSSDFLQVSVPARTNNPENTKTVSKSINRLHTPEVWFTGTHSDM